MPFRSLDPEMILTTAMRLERRIVERFPNRGLAKVAGEVVALSRLVREEVGTLCPPIWGLRALVGSGRGFWPGLGYFSGSARSSRFARSGRTRQVRSKAWRPQSIRRCWPGLALSP